MWEKLAIFCVYLAIRVIGASLRYRVEGEERLQRAIAAGGGVILYSWHEVLLTGAWFFSRYHPAIMISTSRDGERMTGIAERLGWEVVRGSTSRRGVAGTLGLVHHIKRGGVVAQLVDGPGGPPHEAKPGVVLMAQLSGGKLVRASLRPRLAARTGSWDRMWIPLPFSRVDVCFGEPETVDRSLTEAEAEEVRKRLETELNASFSRISGESVV